MKCGRCIRACKDIQGIEVLGFAGRSTNIHITTPFNDEFNNTQCVLCGQCSLACPVGALVEKDDTERVLDAIFDPEKSLSCRRRRACVLHSVMLSVCRKEALLRKNGYGTAHDWF